METFSVTTQNSLFFMPLLVGSIFTVVGLLMYQFPPADINPLYGYRTKNSIKNKERWDFAQTYSAKLMMLCGIALMICSLFGLIFNISEGKGVFFATLEIFTAIAVLLYKTEKAIKEKFK